MTDITREALTYDEDGVATYTVLIKDFHQKMKNWPSSTRGIRSESFKVQGVVLYLSLYPNVYKLGTETMQRLGNVTQSLEVGGTERINFAIMGPCIQITNQTKNWLLYVKS